MAQLTVRGQTVTIHQPGDTRRLERRFVAGLDLGQANDYTALAIAEVIREEATWSLNFSHLERWRRVPYPDIVRIVGERMARLRELGQPVLVVDQTGVGRPVVDLFRQAGMGVNIWPVTIATSAMGQAHRDPTTRDWVVPKKDLVGALQSLAFSDRMHIAGTLPEARTLTQELEHFRMKYTQSANVTYEAWRERDHDDLVLAVALACWAGHRWYKPGGLI